MRKLPSPRPLASLPKLRRYRLLPLLHRVLEALGAEAEDAEFEAAVLAGRSGRGLLEGRQGAAHRCRLSWHAM